MSLRSEAGDRRAGRRDEMKEQRLPQPSLGRRLMDEEPVKEKETVLSPLWFRAEQKGQSG